MAHELSTNDHMVSTRNRTPWHGLGTVLPADTITAAAALEAAKLAWLVTPTPLHLPTGEVVAGHVANVRSDTSEVLSVSKASWTAVQNDRLLSIAEALAQIQPEGGYQPRIETAGSLRNGRTVWALVNVNKGEVAGSAHLSYLLLSNSHVPSRAVRGTLTDVRVVCANTLGATEAAGSKLWVSHTKDVLTRIQAATELLGWATKASRMTFRAYEMLASVRMDADKAVQFFTKLLPETPGRVGQVEELVTLFRTGAGNEGRTAFDALNAVTDYVDHSGKFRGTPTASAEGRMLYATMGNGNGRKNEALKMLLASANLNMAGIAAAVN